MKSNEYKRSRSLFELAKGHSDSKSKIWFSQKLLGPLKSNFICICKMGMEIYTNELVLMTKMANMLVYGKDPQKSYSSEPTDRWL